jgi:hypothetical protein
MSNGAAFESLVAWLIRAAGQSDRAEISEEKAICFLQEELVCDRDTAIAAWQSLFDSFRQKKIVRDGHLVQWQIFRSGFQVSRLATAEEIQSTAEIYESTTPEEVARKIRGLTGIEFERFLTAVLARRPEYRNISVTQASRDGGIDFKGHYVQPDVQAPLIGQAKQVAAAVSASIARDFIGALDTSGERKVFGLFVSTGGFTEPAMTAIQNSRFHIITWDMSDLLKASRGIVTRQISITFEVPDQTFWDEIVGST